MESAIIGLALALVSNSKTWLKRVSKDKGSSLLGLVVSDEGKKFYNIDTWKSFNQLKNLMNSGPTEKFIRRHALGD